MEGNVNIDTSVIKIIEILTKTLNLLFRLSLKFIMKIIPINKDLSNFLHHFLLFFKEGLPTQVSIKNKIIASIKNIFHNALPCLISLKTLIRSLLTAINLYSNPFNNISTSSAEICFPTISFGFNSVAKEVNNSLFL